MTTSKARHTIYLSSDQDLEALFNGLRLLAPLEERGRISRSTAIEAAITLALADLRANGQQAAIFQTMVTLPEVLP